MANNIDAYRAIQEAFETKCATWAYRVQDGNISSKPMPAEEWLKAAAAITGAAAAQSEPTPQDAPLTGADREDPEAKIQWETQQDIAAAQTQDAALDQSPVIPRPNPTESNAANVLGNSQPPTHGKENKPDGPGQGL